MENSKCRKAFAIMSHPGMELLGYSIEKTLTDSKALSEVIIKNGEVYPVMAYIVTGKQIGRAHV